MGHWFNKKRLSNAAVNASAGLLVAVFTIIACASFATLIFNGPLNGFVGTGLRMALTTAVVVGFTVALTSSCRVALAIPQDRIVPILAILAAGIVARMPLASAEEQAATVIAAVVLVTIITGCFLFTLGRLRLGNLVRYVPYPVIGGFLAGSGWLLLIGGLRVMTGHGFDWNTPGNLFGKDDLAHWVPGVVFGVLLFYMLRQGRAQRLIPVLLLMVIAAFYVTAGASGWSVEQLRALEWLPELSSTAGIDVLAPISIVKSVSWGLLLSNFGIIATILVTSVVSILLTASALEISVDQEIDLNKELRAAGMATFISGLAGGIVGFHSLSMSRLALSMGARSRWVGVVAAAGCAAVFWIGPGFVSFVPRFVCGGLLFFLGLIFVWEWVYEAQRKLTRLDYSVVLIILSVVGLAGYSQGVAAGIIAAIVLLVHNYSRVDVVSHAMSGADLRSNVHRPVREQRFLREHGEQLYVLHLQGFIFFGTANNLLQQVRRRALNANLQTLRFVVMDFRRVSGIDSSAVFSLSKVHQLASRHGFTLLMTQVAPQIEKQLAMGGLRTESDPAFLIFPDLDYGLEWCEHHMLRSTESRRNGDDGHLSEQLADLWPEGVESSRLVPYLEQLLVPKSTHLINQSDQSKSMYFIESGRVTAKLELPGEKSLRLLSMGPGTVVGEVGMFLEGRRMASVVTDTDCRVYRLSAERLSSMRNENPALALAFYEFVIRLLAERLSTTGNMLRGFQGEVPERLPSHAPLKEPPLNLAGPRL